MRCLPPLPRRLSHGRIHRALPNRCAEVRLLPHHRAQRPHRTRVPRSDGEPHLWLRRLPRDLSLEQIREELPGIETCRARRTGRSAARRTPGARRRRFSYAVPQDADQAHGPRPVRAQCPDRGGQRGRARTCPAGRAFARDASPLVRAMAVWALQRLAPERASALRAGCLASETDEDVRAEWEFDAQGEAR